LPIPPLPEQKRIAHILGTLDDKIELNRRMNETLEGMARALFKSWFVDFDPVRAKAAGKKPEGMDDATAALFPDSFVDSELGKIPQGWEIRSVYDCARYTNGAAFKAKDFSLDNSGLPIIKIAEIKNGISSQTKFTENDYNDKFFIQDGEILFSWSGSPNTSIDTFLWTGGEGWLNQHIFKIEPIDDNSYCFVFYLLRYLRETFIEIARDKQTTGLGHVTVQDLKRLKVSFPDDGIIKAFEKYAKPFFDIVYNQSLSSKTLANIRDTLLPKLLSGELRVKDGVL